MFRSVMPNELDKEVDGASFVIPALAGIQAF
jgi:hypothetical protein